ncbi:rab GTPase-binding effector protein 2 isoform X1 [Alosa pseudoharengus]|uniref:rab GTPase-binding effector protein 2 isoform X1 n=1 Tax=Alosa pseudoharengus TaxID=34774 RepID=UPI003F8BE37F
MEVSEKPAENGENSGDVVAHLQTQLEKVQAQLEHWQGVATICELSKEEELKELQKHCDQEIQSLQEALRETASQYEARISSLQMERTQWRRASFGNDSKGAGGGVCEGRGSEVEGGELEHTGLMMMGGGYLDSSPSHLDSSPSHLDSSPSHLDASSLVSFSMDTPSLPRRPPQDDTASIVSTGTLVPEAIYLPPPGHRLITHSDWDALHAQVAELQGELTQLREQRIELERELDTQTTETQKQVSVLQSQVQTSEALLQELQQSFSQSQSAVQSRLAELSVSQRRVCSELSRLKGEEPEEEGAAEMNTNFSSSSMQGSHSEERLRIEIVNLKEQLETRTEESEVLEVRLSSLKTETDRIQTQKEKLECELQACRTELQGLRVALAHLQGDKKSLQNDKESLQQQCLEFRSQVISLRTQMDTSQTVQMDFVQLSQSLQVKLELIRQAQTLDQVKAILGEELSSEEAPPSTPT